MQIDPTYIFPSRILNKLGVVALNAGASKTARFFLRLAVTLRADFYYYHRNLGVALERSGRVEEAMECYLTALRLKSDFIIAVGDFMRALSLMSDAAHAVRCYYSFLKVVEWSSFLDVQSRVSAILKCIVDKNIGVDEMIKRYNRHLVLNPQDIEKHAHLAFLWELKGCKKQALEIYRKVSSLKPANTAVILGHGNLLYDMGHVEEAISFWIKSLELERNGQVATRVATVLYDLGRVREALYYCREGVAIDATCTDVHRLASKIHLELGQIDEAAASYKRSLDSGSLSVDRQQILGLDTTSVKEWCEKQILPCAIFEPRKEVYIPEPRFFEARLRMPSAVGQLPEAYVAALRNVTVIGGTTLLIAGKQTALYDKQALAAHKWYTLNSNIVKLMTGRSVVVGYLESGRSLRRAIHFCHDVSRNYFHWLVEGLSRLWLVDQIPEFRLLPLLVDEKLPRQHVEALRLFNQHNHPLITLRNGNGYLVDELIYPSELSVSRDNYNHPVSPENDVLISPTAIAYIRNQALKLISGHKSKFTRRLYVSRRKVSHRRIVNNEQIEASLAKLGFELVCPEQLSFLDQVRIFSEAELIVGQAGSGLVNMIFSPESCKVIVLTIEQPQINYYVFSTLADILKLELEYVFGDRVASNGELEMFDVHSDFWISPEKLFEALGRTAERMI